MSLNRVTSLIYVPDKPFYVTKSCSNSDLCATKPFDTTKNQLITNSKPNQNQL